MSNDEDPPDDVIELETSLTEEELTAAKNRLIEAADEYTSTIIGGIVSSALRKMVAKAEDPASDRLILSRARLMDIMKWTIEEYDYTISAEDLESMADEYLELL